MGSSIGRTIGSIFSFGVDVLGRAVETLDSVLDWPGKLVKGGLNLTVIGKPFAEPAEAICNAICHFGVHKGNFGALKWIKHLRRSSAVRGAVSENIAADSEIDSVTVKSFLSNITDEPLRESLKEYFVLNKAMKSLEAWPDPADPGRAKDIETVKKQLIRLEIAMGQRAELNEMKELAGIGTSTLASEARLMQLAEQMADKMIDRVRNRYKDRIASDDKSWLRMFGGEVTPEWAALAAEGQDGRAALVRKIKDRLFKAYCAERDGGSAEPQVNAIRQDLADAFGSTATFKTAAFMTTAAVIWYGMPVIGPVIQEWGGKAAQWLAQVAPQILPDWVINGWNELWSGLKTAGTWLFGFGALMVGAKGLDLASRLAGDGGSPRPADGVHTDGTRVTDAHTDGSRLHADGNVDTRANDAATRAAADTRAADGSELLNNFRSDADRAAADSAAAQRAAGSDPTTPIRNPIDTGGRGVDPVHAPRPVADVRASDLQGRPQDPNVRIETSRVNPR